MLDNIETLTQILIVVLIVLIITAAVLAFVFFVNKNKASDKKRKKESTTKNFNKESTTTNTQDLNKQSVFKFMEFDKIEDNMIVQKNGKRYIMVVECQGINYDLMSATEKNSVEEGFIQFLNTLRHPIQIYVQTRTVNLEPSIERYNEKIKEAKEALDKEQLKYNQMKESNMYTQKELEQEFYEITKKRNLYEYGKDVVYNTQKMSLNRNVLRKQYYIIVPYYVEEAGNGEYDKEELKNMAFSELYTKAQSIIRTLTACEVSGKILDSYGLADLLYTAYNRDEAETFGLNKAMAAKYEDLYSTAPDIMDKKIKDLDRIIEEKAMNKAVDAVNKVRYARQEEYNRKMNSKEDNIDRLAQLILEQNASYIGEDIAQEAKEEIAKTTRKAKNKKGEDSNVGEEKTVKKRGRKPKAV